MASYVKMAHPRHLSIEATLPPGTRNILAEHFNKHCQWPRKHLKIGGIILRGHFLPSSKRGHFLKLKRILLCLLQNVPPMPPVPTSMKPLCVYFFNFSHQLIAFPLFFPSSFCFNVYQYKGCIIFLITMYAILSDAVRNCHFLTHFRPEWNFDKSS